jgi:hypothetical protein
VSALVHGGIDTGRRETMEEREKGRLGRLGRTVASAQCQVSHCPFVYFWLFFLFFYRSGLGIIGATKTFLINVELGHINTL